MSDAGGQQGPPTYYANIITSLLTVDDLTLEFRRFDKPHREMLATPSQQLAVVPPASTAEVMQHEPIARVVVTFSAATALKEYLDSALPRIEESRRTGRLT